MTPISTCPDETAVDARWMNAKYWGGFIFIGRIRSNELPGRERWAVDRCCSSAEGEVGFRWLQLVIQHSISSFELGRARKHGVKSVARRGNVCRVADASREDRGTQAHGLNLLCSSKAKISDMSSLQMRMMDFRGLGRRRLASGYIEQAGRLRCVKTLPTPLGDTLGALQLEQDSVQLFSAVRCRVSLMVETPGSTARDLATSPSFHCPSAPENTSIS
mgnify:FL=1